MAASSAEPSEGPMCARELSAPIPPDARAGEGYRSRPHHVGYRRLGSVVDAEGLVREAWLRWPVSDRFASGLAARFVAAAGGDLAALLDLRPRRPSRARRCVRTPVTDSSPSGRAPGETDDRRVRRVHRGAVASAEVSPHGRGNAARHPAPRERRLATGRGRREPPVAPAHP